MAFVSGQAHHLVARLAWIVLQGMRRTSINGLNDLTNIELVTTNVVESTIFDTCAGCVLESHMKHERSSRTVTTHSIYRLSRLGGWALEQRVDTPFPTQRTRLKLRLTY